MRHFRTGVNSLMYQKSSGTSNAFPHVGGVAALILAVDNAFSPAEVQAFMAWTAKNLDKANEEGEEEGESEGARDIYYGWGLVDASAALEKAMTPRFAVKNVLSKNVMSIDADGDFVIDGLVVPDAGEGELDYTNDASNFVVTDSSGNVLARLDSDLDLDCEGELEGEGEGEPRDCNPTTDRDWPTLYLKGCLKQVSSPSPPSGDPAFIVKDSANAVVAYISSTDDCTNGIPAGSLVVAGNAFIGANPDPAAKKTELIIFDDFQDSEYTYNPEWTVVSGNWCACTVLNGGYRLTNLATWGYPTFSATEKIRIPQTDSDFAVSLLLRWEDWTDPQPLYMEFRHTATEAIYLKFDPDAEQVSLGKWTSPSTDRQLGEPVSFEDMDEDFLVYLVCSGDELAVRLRHDSAGSPSGELWGEELDFELEEEGEGEGESDSIELTGSQLYFSFRVEHEWDDVAREWLDGIWGIDDLTIYKQVAGSTPEFECSGCP